jgi:hypothetical protein
MLSVASHGFTREIGEIELAAITVLHCVMGESQITVWRGFVRRRFS